MLGGNRKGAGITKTWTAATKLDSLGRWSAWTQNPFTAVGSTAKLAMGN